MRLVWTGAVAGALSLVLAACDSNSSPSPSPTPTPTTSPTPTPTGTPTPTSFTTTEAALQYDLVGGVRVANLTSVAPASGSVFGFTPTTGGYTYTLLNGTVIPTASEAAVFPVSSIKTCERTSLCFGNGYVHNQVANGASNYYLTRLIPGSSDVILLTYVSFGAFEESLVDGTDVDFRSFAYGEATPAASLPTTGTVTFNGRIIGQATGNKPSATGTSNIYRISGTVQLVNNYPAGTATLKLTLAGKAVGCTTCPADINLTYDATGTIANGVVTFTLPGGSGRFFLAGPTGIQMGGTVLLTAADPNDAGVTMTLVASGGGTTT